MDESAKGPGPCPVPDEASHTQQAVLAANQFWRVEWRGVLGGQGGGRNGCRGGGVKCQEGSTPHTGRTEENRT